MSARNVYTYAIARPFDPKRIADVRGVDGAPLRLVRDHDLVAVVSEVSAADVLADRLEDLAELERCARAHLAVVNAVAAQAVTLPLRLATIHHGPERVEDLLRQRRQHIAAALHRVAGCVELGVKAYERPDDSGSPDDEPDSSSPGRSYLQRRRLQARRRDDRQRELASAAQQLHDELAGVAVDQRLHRPQDAGNVLNAAYLVAETRIDVFLARTGQSRHPAFEIVVTGPWAPHSFAALDEDGAS